MLLAVGWKSSDRTDLYLKVIGLVRALAQPRANRNDNRGAAGDRAAVLVFIALDSAFLP
jgi:hypothetical protein